MRPPVDSIFKRKSVWTRQRIQHDWVCFDAPGRIADGRSIPIGTSRTHLAAPASLIERGTFILVGSVAHLRLFAGTGRGRTCLALICAWYDRVVGDVARLARLWAARTVVASLVVRERRECPDGDPFISVAAIGICGRFFDRAARIAVVVGPAAWKSSAFLHAVAASAARGTPPRAPEFRLRVAATRVRAIDRRHALRIGDEPRPPALICARLRSSRSRKRDNDCEGNRQ